MSDASPAVARARGARALASRLAREPMLHFALAGAAIFALHAWLAPQGVGSKRIVVDKAVVGDLSRQFEATWQRPATAQELRALVDNYVRDEVLYREGVALGLDRDDPIVKRRVRQKLEMMAEDDPAAKEPTGAELSAYLASHAARYTQPAVYTFEQVFLGDGSAPASVEHEAAAARSALAAGTDPRELGRATLLPHGADAQPADLVARDFGEAFTSALAKVPIGAWSGPVPSSYGFHLVRVGARRPAVVPPLAEVREAVARDFERERRERTVRERYAALRAGYDVVVEAPIPTGTRPTGTL
jgi:parvulin-like peptidyl-prolyl cis-trans isomerase-like protein